MNSARHHSPAVDAEKKLVGRSEPEYLRGADLLRAFGAIGKKPGFRRSLPPSAFVGGGGDLLRACGAKQVGFTLIELVMVILLLGILSFFAVARLADRSESDAHGFAEQLASTLRFAQKAAVAQRRAIYVNVDAANGRVWVCLDAANTCTQPLAAPAGGTLEVQAPRGVTLTTTGGTQLTFDAMGRPSSTAAIDFGVDAASIGFTVRIEPESGYVRRT
jgi:MSHA pilin protein MshC